MSTTIFEKEYDGESIVDINRDIMESFDPDFNPRADVIPNDEYGFHQGTFKVTVVWSPDE